MNKTKTERVIVITDILLKTILTEYLSIDFYKNTEIKATYHDTDRNGIVVILSDVKDE